MTYKIRFATGLLCMVCWFLLVWFNRAPVEPFVEMLKALLVGVATYHATLTPPKG